MDILTVKFTGIDADRTENVEIGEIDLNVNVSDFEPQKNGTAFVRFTYIVTYKPDIGRLVLSGFVVVRDTPKEITRVAGLWKKNRRLPADIEKPLLNMISASSTTSAIFVGHVVDLTPPFVPPLITG